MGNVSFSDSGWHLARGGKTYGPIADRKLLRLAEQGKLRPDDLLWKRGFEDWKAASSIPGILNPPVAPSAKPIPTRQSRPGETDVAIKQTKREGRKKVVGVLIIGFLFVFWIWKPSPSYIVGAPSDLVSPVQSKCERKGRSALAAVVVCPKGLAEIDWRIAGKAACPFEGPCNAWIWDDAENAPARPPMTDAQVNSAVAVWINNTQTLNVCARGGC